MASSNPRIVGDIQANSDVAIRKAEMPVMAPKPRGTGKSTVKRREAVERGRARTAAGHGGAARAVKATNAHTQGGWHV